MKGFTLIELMITIAIIGIISAIAIPAYNDFIIKAKWQQNVGDIAAVKQAVTNCMLRRNNISTLCDNITVLQEFEYPGSSLPQPTYATAPIVVSTQANTVNITFTGTSEVRGLVYDANYQLDTYGNARFKKTTSDTLGKFYPGDGR